MLHFPVLCCGSQVQLAAIAWPRLLLWRRESIFTHKRTYTAGVHGRVKGHDFFYHVTPLAALLITHSVNAVMLYNAIELHCSLLLPECAGLVASGCRENRAVDVGHKTQPPRRRMNSGRADVPLVLVPVGWGGFALKMQGRLGLCLVSLMGWLCSI